MLRKTSRPRISYMIVSDKSVPLEYKLAPMDME